MINEHNSAQANTPTSANMQYGYPTSKKTYQGTAWKPDSDFDGVGIGVAKTKLFGVGVGIGAEKKLFSGSKLKSESKKKIFSESKSGFGIKK